MSWELGVVRKVRPSIGVRIRQRLVVEVATFRGVNCEPQVREGYVGRFDRFVTTADERVYRSATLYGHDEEHGACPSVSRSEIMWRQFLF